MSVPIKIIGFDFLIHSSYKSNTQTCKFCGKSLYIPKNNKSEVVIDEHKNGFHKTCNEPKKND
jgi:hypothetical protein